MAMPVIAFLFLIDVTLALLGRIEQQLQLLTLAFPLKMAAALAILVAITPTLVKLFTGQAERTIRTLWRGLGY